VATQALTSPAIVVARSSWRRYAASFNCRIGLLVLVLVPAEIFLARRLHLNGLLQFADVWSSVPGIAILLGCLCYGHHYRLVRIIDTCELAIWSRVLMSVFALLFQIAGRSPYPFADRQLNTIDARMHVQTASIVHMVARLPPLVTVLDTAYTILPVLILCAILVPPFFGDAVASRRFVTGTVLASLIGVVLFGFLPVAGPWITQPLLPTPKQAAVTAYFVLLKSPGPVRLNYLLGGIVSFPSFHVVYAILSAAALGSIRMLRIPVWILATLICISTITTGWHYGIDVLAGFILSIIVIWLARQIEPNGCPAQHSR